ncbi:tetratricopeptide repeat protein [Acidipila sp. EB88]|uniref:tetratricopeptide repeat protein n=1 Tax=Acidipila sp. EB88 TaxID=2305226 RepID=UPI001315269E|nr:tetratricopeptide repeat protein [Acidipila sp. EB88]
MNNRATMRVAGRGWSRAAWWLFLLLMPFVSARAQVAGSAADSPAVSLDRLQEGDAAGALAAAQRALRSAPRDCRLLSLQGVALNTLARRQEALASFDAALAVCPNSLPALEGAAEIEFARGQEAAAPLLLRILAVRPDDATTHAMLATTQGREGECGNALVHFERARVLFPAQPALLLDYGSCLARLEEWPEAEVVFAQLQTEQPSSEATYDLAVAQWKAGEAKQALTTLEPLLGAGADERSLVLGSSIAEAASDTPRAVALLRTAIVLEPDRVDNYLAFARLADAHQSAQVGIDMINAGLTRLPKAAPLFVSRGVLHVQMSQFAEAEADFAHAHQLDPQLSLAMDAVGILETQRHENAASLALFREQAKLHPQDALLAYLLAEALSEADGGDTAEAIAQATKACALEPDNQQALDLLAKLYLRADQPALALEQAERALKRDPNDSLAIYAEIRSRHKLGDEAAVPGLLKRLELAKKTELARDQESSRYRFTETK